MISAVSGRQGQRSLSSDLPERHFQTGWFVESLMTQTLMIHVIRTNEIPFLQSRASGPLTVTSHSHRVKIRGISPKGGARSEGCQLLFLLCEPRHYKCRSEQYTNS